MNDHPYEHSQPVATTHPTQCVCCLANRPYNAC